MRCLNAALMVFEDRANRRLEAVAHVELGEMLAMWCLTVAGLR
jgi:hypothetical protein